MSQSAAGGLWKLTLGIGNQATVVRGSRLLYAELLADARRNDIAGGTVIQTITGSCAGSAWRSLNSEIGSNELPVIAVFIDEPSRLQSWLPRTRRLLEGKGVIALEPLNNQSEFEVRGFEPGSRLEVFIMESAMHKNIPLYQLVAERLRQDGAAWVSVQRALTGFGSARSFHRAGWFRRRQDVPVVVTALLPRQQTDTAAKNVRDILGGMGYVTANSTYWMMP